MRNTDRRDAAPDYAGAFTPRQLIGGFAILAALLVWFLRRRRGRARAARGS